jgi:hypothetical protein
MRVSREVKAALAYYGFTPSLSRVPRLSPRDVAALLGVSEEEALRAMFGAAKRGKGLAVLRITYKGEERYLLVKVM